jgi:hypothetical protein
VRGDRPCSPEILRHGCHRCRPIRSGTAADFAKQINDLEKEKRATHIATNPAA